MLDAPITPNQIKCRRLMMLIWYLTMVVQGELDCKEAKNNDVTYLDEIYRFNTNQTEADTVVDQVDIRKTDRWVFVLYLANRRGYQVRGYDPDFNIIWTTPFLTTISDAGRSRLNILQDNQRLVVSLLDHNSFYIYNCSNGALLRDEHFTSTGTNSDTFLITVYRGFFDTVIDNDDPNLIHFGMYRVKGWDLHINSYNHTTYTFLDNEYDIDTNYPKLKLNTQAKIIRSGGQMAFSTIQTDTNIIFFGWNRSDILFFTNKEFDFREKKIISPEGIVYETCHLKQMVDRTDNVSYIMESIGFRSEFIFGDNLLVLSKLRSSDMKQIWRKGYFIKSGQPRVSVLFQNENNCIIAGSFGPRAMLLKIDIETGKFVAGFYIANLFERIFGIAIFEDELYISGTRIRKKERRGFVIKTKATSFETVKTNVIEFKPIEVEEQDPSWLLRDSTRKIKIRTIDYGLKNYVTQPGPPIDPNPPITLDTATLCALTTTNLYHAGVTPITYYNWQVTKTHSGLIPPFICSRKDTVNIYQNYITWNRAPLPDYLTATERPDKSRLLMINGTLTNLTEPKELPISMDSTTKNGSCEYYNHKQLYLKLYKCTVANCLSCTHKQVCTECEPNHALNTGDNKCVHEKKSAKQFIYILLTAMGLSMISNPYSMGLFGTFCKFQLLQVLMMIDVPLAPGLQDFIISMQFTLVNFDQLPPAINIRPRWLSKFPGTPFFFMKKINYDSESWAVNEANLIVVTGIAAILGLITKLILKIFQKIPFMKKVFKLNFGEIALKTYMCANFFILISTVNELISFFINLRKEPFNKRHYLRNISLITGCMVIASVVMTFIGLFIAAAMKPVELMAPIAEGGEEEDEDGYLYEGGEGGEVETGITQFQAKISKMEGKLKLKGKERGSELDLNKEDQFAMTSDQIEFSPDKSINSSNIKAVNNTTYTNQVTAYEDEPILIKIPKEPKKDDTPPTNPRCEKVKRPFRKAGRRVQKFFQPINDCYSKKTMCKRLAPWMLILRNIMIIPFIFCFQPHKDHGLWQALGFFSIQLFFTAYNLLIFPLKSRFDMAIDLLCDFTVLVCAGSMFYFILNEQSQKYTRLQKDIRRISASRKLLQFIQILGLTTVILVVLYEIYRRLRPVFYWLKKKCMKPKVAPEEEEPDYFLHYGNKKGKMPAPVAPVINVHVHEGTKQPLKVPKRPKSPESDDLDRAEDPAAASPVDRKKSSDPLEEFVPMKQGMSKYLAVNDSSPEEIGMRRRHAGDDPRHPKRRAGRRNHGDGKKAGEGEGEGEEGKGMPRKLMEVVRDDDDGPRRLPAYKGGRRLARREEEYVGFKDHDSLGYKESQFREAQGVDGQYVDHDGRRARRSNSTDGTYHGFKDHQGVGYNPSQFDQNHAGLINSNSEYAGFKDHQSLAYKGSNYPDGATSDAYAGFKDHPSRYYNPDGSVRHARSLSQDQLSSMHIPYKDHPGLSYTAGHHHSLSGQIGYKDHPSLGYQGHHHHGTQDGRQQISVKQVGKKRDFYTDYFRRQVNKTTDLEVQSKSILNENFHPP